MLSATWPTADAGRAPEGPWPPRWASAWGDDAWGAWADWQVGGVVQRLRWIEPGAFTMGSTVEELRLIADKQIRKWADEREAPAHRVVLTQGFWLADTPCTQALWMAVMDGANPSFFKEGEAAPQRPVEQVSWDDAQGFVVKLGQRLHGLGVEAALPTDAQWEYACRAGTQTAYGWGDGMEPGRANVGGKGTTRVKQYAPNGWGLYDMHGNVWEWCVDGLRTYDTRSQQDPEGPPDGEHRVARGGAWLNPAAGARSAFRFLRLRGFRDRSRGFRLALRSPRPGGQLPGPGGPVLGRGAPPGF